MPTASERIPHREPRRLPAWLGLATSGPYAYVRHPHYVAFIVIMFGFLLQWPAFIPRLRHPQQATAPRAS
jgi:isoprenylcysteine carboxyl methyltransferase (ICMT) family protein